MRTFVASDLGPSLETERLLLRPPLAEDFENFALFMADPLSARFVGGVQPRSVAWRGFATLIGALSLRGFSMFSVIEKASDQWVGRIGPWQPEGWPGQEIAWGLRQSAWGKGYATEAATACMNWVFNDLGWEHVIHSIDPANEASKSVAARLGSTLLREGVLPPPAESTPIEIWGQSRSQWYARQA